MKDMKSKGIYLVLCVCAFLPNFHSVKAQVVEKTNPGARYNVHRQYDDKGNLVEYDSTSIYTWNSDSSQSNSGPLIDSWNLDAANSNSDTNSIENYLNTPFGFDFNDIDFFSPSFPNIEDIFRGGNGYYFPADSNLIKVPPGSDTTLFYDGSIFSTPFDEDFEAKIRDMQMEINKFMQGQMEQHKNRNELYKEIPKPIEPDTINMPSQKKPLHNTKTEKSINI
jgi:hypothetical protein